MRLRVGKHRVSIARIYAVITLALIPACAAQIERPKIVLTSTSHAPQVAPLKPVPFPIYHPAIEFDHPYKGELTIVTAQSAEDLQKACRNLPAALGCSERWATRCTITLAPDSIIKAYGWTKEAVIRHETAHCNGWHVDHRGWRR